MRNRNTIEFLGIWEYLFNPSFNPLEFEGFRKEAGLNAFTMSPSRWIEATNAKGLVAMAGRYGGTYARTVMSNYQVAIRQMKVLEESENRKYLK